MADVIDITNKDEQDFYTQTLLKGFDLDLDRDETRECIYLLKQYLETEFVYTAMFSNITDTLTIIRQDKEVLLMVFNGSQIEFEPPEDFLSTQTELESFGLVLVICVQFVDVYKSLYGPEPEEGQVLTFPPK